MPTNAAAAAEPGAGRPHGHRGQRAVQRMLEFAPATGSLALWVRHEDSATPAPGQPALPLSTDGQTLRYHPAFAALPLAQQVGWVAHAVLHVALRHPQRYRALQQQLGDVDLPLYNTCADALVNSTLDHLGWLELPAGTVRLDALLAAAGGVRQGVEAALLQWDVESLYRRLDDRRESGKSGTRGREDGPRAARARAMGARDAHDLRPDPAADAAPERETEAAREWRERLLRAHAGDGEFSMLRTLGADLPGVRTPWQQVLRVQLARALSARPALSWSRPSRSYLANRGRAGRHGGRLPFEPSFSAARPVPRLALMVDVSGSVDEALLARFAQEVEALTRRLEAALVLIIGDDRVRRVEHHAPGRARLPSLAVEGGGGTDFTPLLQEAARHRPDIGVVLTDLEGPARWQPPWPVVWAVPPAHAQAQPPFGRLLVLR